ncbi:DUF4238 domain-containing protein [Desulforhopalus vacuolatus]|uniref:DUF4238 domain-containing protein n=1 Tax=Desulforhopalus vacuolatus TaxID=40414 RepID=UPI0019625571|nr:DUF4238 domain-containing protein [Desulforhopalus vacuolatus]MBM9519011.1 DUF4238 domain-containing protein [Desulforhopalus vacuolatus]
MEKHKQIKRNHHYVWSYYLKSWATGNNIFYISKTGKIACDSVKGLAKETDFYKISTLNQKDIEFIKRILVKSPQFLQEIHMSYLDDFIKLSNFSGFISKVKNAPEELLSVQKAMEHNSLENLHSFIEGTAVEVISKLAQGDSECLKSKNNMMAFCSYVGHQMSRIKSFKEKSIGAVRVNPDIGVEHKELKELLALFEKNWWFLSFMFGTSIGYSLYESKDRDNHIFITNNTGHPFITSDHPVINVHSSLALIPERKEPESADFYIPLSPKYAYMINNSEDYNHLAYSIGLDDVKKLNKKIINKSYRTVFGSSEAVLKIHNKRVN